MSRQRSEANVTTPSVSGSDSFSSRAPISSRADAKYSTLISILEVSIVCSIVFATSKWIQRILKSCAWPSIEALAEMKVDGASAGRKPWRYYYVMVFQLSGNSVAPDKLQEMTEMTAAIEQREEKYLRKVAARNAAHAAAMEAERKAQEEKKPTMISHVACVLRRLFLLSIILLLLTAAVGCALYWKYDEHDRVSQKLVNVVIVSMLLLLLKDIGGWVVAHKRSVNGARVLFVVGFALIIALALLLDEIVIVRRSHSKLREALARSEDSLSQDMIEVILNGGAIPSLVQRFVFDAPSVFLQWISVHCSSAKLEYTSVAIDRREFFSPLWDDTEKACVNDILRICVQVNEAIESIIIGELVMISLQVLLTGMFLIVYDPVVSDKSKRRRKLSSPKVNASSFSDLFTALTRLLVFGAASFGVLNTAASTDLLHFCSIADFHTLFTWVMVICLLSGISAMLAALFIGCGWKQQVAGVLLVIAVCSEVFMLGEFFKLAARLIGPDTNQTQLRELRQVYIKASAQTCSSIERWISHVCVGMNSSEEPAEFDFSCQHEFVALLMVTFNFTNSYLSWSIGVKLVLLVQILLPPLRQAIENMLSSVCCVPRNELTTMTVKTIIQESSPPLDYEEALEVYLRSLRVRDPDRMAAEREAFEKEWSSRTGRVLSDVRTPRVVVSSSDFSAIVRTLMLRRLTAICKLDVSLSVSEDGQLLLVRISASDNLLLATSCETESYRLQFADAIDPGRSFWRDKKEVNTDQKVLDANTVKHKLKILLAENAMSPKEAVWFPGESLARVSARIHALSRISRVSKGLIRCHNSAPAFASYSPNIQRQFIYKKYPHKLDIPDTYRRSTVLRTVDCIRVTRRIIDAEFDTNNAIASGLLSSFHCLHSSSRFDFNSRSALASSWIKFWSPTHLPGEFYPDDHAILNLIGRIAPFRQPLRDVKDYFGEKIGFYFAWLAFYAKMMMIPAIIAIVAITSETKHSLMISLWDYYIPPTYIQGGSTEVGRIDTTIPLPELLLGVLVIVWSFSLAKLWERRSVWYQLQWDIAAKTDSFQRYNADHGIEYTRSLCSSAQRQLVSWLCVLVLGGVNLLVTLTVLLSQGLLVDVWGEKVAVLSSCICQALLIQWNGACIPYVAPTLSKWENPYYSRDHHGYQRSFVAKLFALQLVNTFSGLILLMLSGVGGLALPVQFLTPLIPLYMSYSARIEGHVGVFIQMETLLIAIFAVQLSIRVFLILSALRRFHIIQRGDQRKEHEEETMLSPYPGPGKDYAQVVMQIGLIIMFSSVCPLLPMLALIDCAVKIRQNALELCCIRQRPEPEEYDVEPDLWASYMLLMVKLSVPVALSLALFTVDNFADISIERRIGYWLIGVLCFWLGAQLLWFLIPRESRAVEEARARNIFQVERYFGHAEVHEQKTSPKDTNEKRVEDEDINLQEATPSVEQSLHHYEERLELLHRLNVALRKRDDIGGTVSLANMTVSTPDDQEAQTSEGMKERTHSVSAEEFVPFDDEDKPQHRDSKDSEEMIVGYFRPVRSVWPPPAQRPAQQEGIGGDEAPAIDIMEPSEEPKGSIYSELPVEGATIGENIDERIASAAESGGESAPPVSPVLLSKLFTRMPTFPSTFMPSSSSEEVDAALLPSTSPFVSASLTQADIEPGVFAPTEAEIINRESVNDDDLLEEKEDVSLSTTDAAVESPRRSFLSRIRSRQVKSSISDSNKDSQVEAGERALLRQLSPRLSSLPRKSKRLSSKVSGSEESKSESSSVREPPAPKRLSNLFKRAQSPSTRTTPPSEPPPIVTNREAEDTTVDPVAPRHDQFAFLSDTHEEQSSLSIQRRTSSSNRTRPPSPPPVYTRIDLSGLEAVREAANRHQFDFSADEQVWEE
ncbi:hypothetical protein L914_02387 [Phytophthora nicotianae]|uniref:Anoctamin transmembrane domain-containing protein n=1 Tax=Phytophthora nicotianae TaxID=4792 RepID=W2P2T6_PHYNI|nr:hypothetical protein L914_02387 [Phytophthora nicotianae]